MRSGSKLVLRKDHIVSHILAAEDKISTSLWCPGQCEGKPEDPWWFPSNDGCQYGVTCSDLIREPDWRMITLEGLSTDSKDESLFESYHKIHLTQEEWQEKGTGFTGVAVSPVQSE